MFPYLLRRADRYCALGHHQLGAAHQSAYGVGHRQHMLQIGRAILVSRGADGDQQQIGVCHGNGGIDREAQAAAGKMALDQRGQPRLIEGSAPA